LFNVTKPTHQACKYAICNDDVRFDHRLLSLELKFATIFPRAFTRKGICVINNLFQWQHYSCLQNKERDLKQGCPLALYLFLIVGEVLNIMISQVMAKGEIR
jgi:hypothetical protein